MQTKPILAMVMASMMIVPLALADSGKGKDGNGSGGTSGVANADVRLIAKMLPTNSQDPLFEGHVVRRTQGTARDEFEARVEVPVSLLSGRDPADVHPDLLLTGAIQCVMVLDQVDLVTGVAEYKTSLRSRNGVTVNRAGSCNVQGIPNVFAGNSASVDFGNNNTLQGQFIAKR